MNPNDNLTPVSPNPTAPEPEKTEAPAAVDYNNLTMTDELASAQESLTAAGQAGTAPATSVGLDEIQSDQPEAIMENPIPEPLVPAAPAPGSIGSAASGAPVATETVVAETTISETPASPFTPFSPATETTPAPETAEPTNPEPAAEAPYNPFSNGFGAASETNTTDAINPAFQPAAPVSNLDKPKSKGSKNLGLILLTVIAAIAAVAFGALYFMGQANPKVVYVTQNTQQPVISNLSCAQVVDFSAYTGAPLPALRIVSANFSNDTLTNISSAYRMTTIDQVTADAMRTNIENETNGYEGALEGQYSTEGGIFAATITSTDTFDEEAARAYVYGAGAEGDLTLEAVQAKYQSLGYTCLAE